MVLKTIEAADLVTSLLGPRRWMCRQFGAGKFSETYAVSSPDGDEYVLRIAPPDTVLQLFYEYRMMRQEPEIHRILLAETTVPVPEIVGFDFSQSLVDRDFLIMRRMSGSVLSEAGLTGRQQERAYREWGSYVAQIHAVIQSENRFGYLGEQACMEPAATWKQAFREMYRKELEDIVGCGVYTKGQSDDAMALLERH